MLFPPPQPPDRVTVSNPGRGIIDWGTVRRPWLQVLATVALATGIAWSSRLWPPGPWNLLALLGPMLISFGANTRAARWTFGIMLVLIFVGSMVTNEAAAHAIWETCLYD